MSSRSLIKPTLTVSFIVSFGLEGLGLEIKGLSRFGLIFTALHGMQTRSSDEISVCLSVCLSNACIVTKQKKNLSRSVYRAKDHSV